MAAVRGLCHDIAPHLRGIHVSMDLIQFDYEKEDPSRCVEIQDTGPMSGFRMVHSARGGHFLMTGQPVKSVFWLRPSAAARISEF
jgi:hypothetical protein